MGGCSIYIYTAHGTVDVESCARPGRFIKLREGCYMYRAIVEVYDYALFVITN